MNLTDQLIPVLKPAPLTPTFPSLSISAAQSEGRPCEYNSKIYQNGESFQPNCKHQCTCIDGAVGCIPLCPQELSLPNLGCPSPKLVKVPGQCCEEWVCDENKGVLDELEGFFSKEFGLDDSEGELTRNNELIAIVKGGLKMLPGEYGLISGLTVKGRRWEDGYRTP